MWVAEQGGKRQRDLADRQCRRRRDYRSGAGAGRGARDLAQRHHHHRRPVSRFESGSGGTILVSAFHARDRARPPPRRFTICTSTAAFRADMRLAFVAGVAVSAVAGFVVIAWFLRSLQRNTLMLFVYYRIIFGIIVLALAFFRPPAG